MQNLSHLAHGSLSMGCSMAGGNVISDAPPFGAAGSPSEQTADLPYNPQHNDPEMQLGPNADKQLSTKGNDAGEFHVTPRAWKKVT